MTETSNDGALKKLLLKKAKEDQQQSRELVLSEQQKLLNDLNSKYNDALSTTLNDIQETLSSRLGGMALLTAQEAQTVQRMVEDHQKKLNDVLRNHYSQASKLIRKQTEPATESLDRLTASLEKATKAAERSERASRRRWVTGLLVGLSAFLIISGASWGLLQYLSGQVQQNLVTIDQQKEMINHLNDQSLGLQIINDPKGTFLILPQHAETGFTVGERSAIRLQRN